MSIADHSEYRAPDSARVVFPSHAERILF